LVVRAALADILDDNKAWLALACSIHEYLVGSTCINSEAPLGDFVIGVSLRALAADSTNAIKVRDAITLESVQIEFLVVIAVVAVVVGTGGNLGCRFAVLAVFSVD